MITRFIVLFLGFYVSIILPVKTPSPSPRNLRKNNSNPPAVIPDSQVIQDNNDLPTTLDKDAPNNFYSIEKNEAPTEDSPDAADMTIISPLTSTDENEEKEEIEEEEEEKTIPINTKAFEQYFAKKVNDYNKQASILHFSLNDNEELFTITTAKDISIYSAITGERKKTIPHNSLIIRTKFIGNNILQVISTSASDNNGTVKVKFMGVKYRIPRRQVDYSYINLADETVTEPIPQNATEPNKLWASVTLRSLPTKEHDTNQLDIVRSRSIADTYNEESMPVTIIKGFKRCVVIKQDPVFEILMYNMEAYAQSSPDSRNKVTHSPPPDYQK